MAYSTIKELRSNEEVLKEASSPDLTDDVILNRIDRADKKVRVDLSNVAVFTFDDDDTPETINMLSNFKATELVLIWLYTRKRVGVDQDDIDYWRNEYEELKDQAMSGEASLGIAASGTATFTNAARKDVEPALGTDKWGDFQTLEELQEERPTET